MTLFEVVKIYENLNLVDRFSFHEFDSRLLQNWQLMILSHVEVYMGTYSKKQKSRKYQSKSLNSALCTMNCRKIFHSATNYVWYLVSQKFELKQNRPSTLLALNVLSIHWDQCNKFKSICLTHGLIWLDNCWLLSNISFLQYTILMFTLRVVRGLVCRFYFI